MEIVNTTPFAASQSDYLQDNEPDSRNRHVTAAILLSLAIHLCGGCLIQRIAGETPHLQRMHAIEVTIVDPVQQNTPVPLPTPIMTKKALANVPPRPNPVPVPVAPAKTAPMVERVSPPVETKKFVASPAQQPLPLPVALSPGKSSIGTQAVNAPAVVHGPAATSSAGGQRTGNGAAELPVVGPSYDAAYLSNPAPQYPAAARRLRLQGTATIRVLVTPEGRPKTVKLAKTSGARVLDDAALDAVQHWLFVPARRGGKAFAAEVDVPICFRLN
ncbi:MAG TPA: energy transducer TonB [Geobacteraceae bacterium]|nr:energy transducer TonB [Geobacteraceae bacterium]